MSKKFVLNKSGVRELLKGEAMMAVVAGKATAAVSRLGRGYEMNAHVGKNRVNAMVYARSYKAKKDNLQNNSILKSLR